MSMLMSLVMHPGPFAQGAEGPLISLTADDGTWIQSRDYKDDRYQVVVWVADPDDADTGRWLQSISALVPRLEELGCVVYGVNHRFAVELRESRANLGLDFPLVYDTLAVTARQYHQSGRRPYVRDGLVVLDRDHRVLFHEQGQADPAATVRAIEAAEGVQSKVDDALPVAGPGVNDIDSKGALRLLTEASGYKLLDVRTQSEFDADHAPMAVLFPVEELPQTHGTIGQKSKLITVCQTGDRSRSASEFLVSVGYTDVWAVSGGMAEWVGDTERTDK